MDTSITRPYKRLEQCNDPETSATLHAAYGEPTLLNLGSKVFLSHSGVDKGFVRRLSNEIRRSYHGIKVAFFDEESLPKGKAIDMEISILEEARNSALGVLVLTDDFFMHTPNPMFELGAFVAGKVDLLPLFLKMSVDEFKQKERWNKWENEWKKWATTNDKVKIDEWRSYLSTVSRYNGLEFCKMAPCGREDLYIGEVVREITSIIGVAVPMSEKDVYGKDRLCQMIDDVYKECSSKQASAKIASVSSSLDLGENSGLYTYDLVGIHGFSGLGKTTLSKCLCDFYFQNMKGNVCYIDLGSKSETRHSRMQHVLYMFDRRNCKDIRSLQLDDIQVENLLKERLSFMQDPVFLAIDNIPPERTSQEETLFYLRCNFPKGSKILITSRAERTLMQLIDQIHQSCSFSTVIYMPQLKYEEARDIFQHGIPSLSGFWLSNPYAAEGKILRDIDACVSKCTIFNGSRYHPLMLKSLAAFVKWDKLMPSLDCKKRLAKLASKGIVHKDDAWEQVFEFFDTTYRPLSKKEKQVFLDLALCYSDKRMDYRDYYEWIQMLHLTYNFKERDLEKTLLRLHNFCFIENERHNIKIHDLMVEFGKHKAGISDGYLVLEGGGADWLDALDLPRTVRHVNISRCGLRRLDLRNVKGVTVLHLLDNAGLAEVLLSRTCSKHLRSMIVRVPAGTALRCVVNEDWSHNFLKFIQIEGKFNFQPASERSLKLPNPRMDPGSTFLGGSLYLQHFSLTSLRSVETIDLTPCANLKLLHLSSILGLKSIQGPENSSHLNDVSIKGLPHLEELAITVPAHEMTYFGIEMCASLQEVSLKCMTPSIRNAVVAASVDGLSQFLAARSTSLSFLPAGSADQRYILKNARINSTRCEAALRTLRVEAIGLAGATELELGDVQHIGPLISALFQAQSRHHRELRFQCEQAGYGSSGCTCDQIPPIFCALPEEEDGRLFHYCCQQVRDLSSLVRWRSLHRLTLSGCTNVEVWPDFAAMTSLRVLDFSNNTGLREWPPGVHLLPSLEYLDLRGCPQLPAKEVMLRTITPTHPWDSTETDPWSLASPLGKCWWAFSSLRMDLRNGTRDRRTVAVALGELSVELAALFDRWWPQSAAKRKILTAILALIYEVFKKGARVSADGQEQHITERMIALLSTESFLSLPFRACSCDCVGNGSTFSYTGAVIGALGLYAVRVMGGRVSSTDSHRARHLRDMTIFLFRIVIGFLMKSIHIFNDFDKANEYTDCSLKLDREVVREEVGVGLRRMAREAGLEVEEGSPESQELEKVRERAVEALCTLVAGNSDEVKVDDIIEEMRVLWIGSWPVDRTRLKFRLFMSLLTWKEMSINVDLIISQLQALWRKRWPSGF